MRSGTIAFFLGILAVQGWSALPDSHWCTAIPVLLLCAWRWPRLRLPALFAAGMLWAVWRAALILGDALPPELEGETITVVGEVVGLPEMAGDRLRFRFQTESLSLGARQWPGCGRIRLDWRGEPVQALHAGERWRLQVRLKRPHGFSNPGGFDYERWLFQHRLRATGYVVPEGRHERLRGADIGLDAARERIRTQIRDAIGEHPLSGVVTALAIGARDGISPEQWQVFFRTNTGHLIAISGLHIGLIAAFGFFIGRWLWSLSRRAVLWIPAPRIGAACGVIAAAIYCALAGFEVPAQRTLIMIAVVMMTLWRSRRIRTADTLLAALALVLIVDPLAVLAVGFWLSFVAVAILLYSTSGARGRGRWWQQAGRAHVAMAIGLAPLLAWLFGQNPLLGPLANLIAVPWISFVVVPLVLLGTLLLSLFPFLGYWCLRGALLALELLWAPLVRLAEFDWATLHLAHPGWLSILCAGLGALILLLPRGMPGRALGVIWMGPLFLHAAPRPVPGDYWFTVLDVGQGLAAVVRTHAHVLVFDAGPAYSERFDTGSAVVVPYLRHAGIEVVDRLIVSHGDNDHIGGVPGLLAHMPVREVLSSVPEKIAHAQVSACAAGQSWEWDGVRFSMLNPPPAAVSSDNDASCVLRVQARGGAALLTGDIETATERRLAEAHGPALRAQVMIAPHHGSATSSSAFFVRAVRPDYVVYPVGYRNRWRFPREDVQQRYRDVDAMPLRTDHDGAVTFHVRASVGPPQRHRQVYRRYWHAH